ncbi:hypothetical protein DB32_001694 [Sandaracinus amylolyticus]|uniref:Uncharacterized protein n=1 Tax=Sandaracinus amylolyticus TaxID=927083 RepID=A0A0F6YH42_9BACT|nr:hypothetical protein DB32_001694 [Sandaracinus amylolyticus]
MIELERAALHVGQTRAEQARKPRHPPSSRSHVAPSDAPHRVDPALRCVA